jgi:hypothetical protein
MVALVVPWSLIKEIMKKDGAARETEENWRDSRDTNRSRLVLGEKSIDAAYTGKNRET